VSRPFFFRPSSSLESVFRPQTSQKGRKEKVVPLFFGASLRLRGVVAAAIEARRAWLAGSQGESCHKRDRARAWRERERERRSCSSLEKRRGGQNGDTSAPPWPSQIRGATTPVDEAWAQTTRRRAIQGARRRRRAGRRSRKGGRPPLSRGKKALDRENEKKTRLLTVCWEAFLCGKKACVCVAYDCVYEKCRLRGGGFSYTGGETTLSLSSLSSSLKATATPRPCPRRTRPRWARPVMFVVPIRPRVGIGGGEQEVRKRG
jgi:hypothetical protein